MTQAQHDAVVETSAQKRARKEAEREAARAEAARKEAAELEEMRKTRPGLLFNLMTRLEKMSRMGLDVSVSFVASTHPSDAYRTVEEGEPGVRVELGRRSEDGYRDAEVYTVVSEEWRFEVLETKLERLQAEYDEKVRMKALAQEAKKLLTAEQLAALKQFG